MLTIQEGDIADGSYPGYVNRDERAAELMLAYLAPAADRVIRVFVAYNRTETDPFWRHIRDKKLGKRCATLTIGGLPPPDPPIMAPAAALSSRRRTSGCRPG
ncbi:MAG: hypothetical protein H0T05_00020 [Acidobacteria bacterium]|nr:hypothetical protein [Acidobacteriota bacterium]MBA3887398.1 hypothetical protein [Acidobacteriota bacterium]